VDNECGKTDTILKNLDDQTNYSFIVVKMEYDR
jgi:hypothetical protein